MNLETAAIISSVLAAVAAVASAFSSWRSAKVAKQALELQVAAREPQVRVRVQVNDEQDDVGQIDLVVENTGATTAWDIVVSTSCPLPIFAWGYFPNKADTGYETALSRIRDESEVSPTGPVPGRLPALAAGERRRYCWGNYGGLYAHLQERSVTFSVEYEIDSGRRVATKSVVEIASLGGVTMRGPDRLKDIARHLRDIERSLGRIASAETVHYVASWRDREERDLILRAGRSRRSRGNL